MWVGLFAYNFLICYLIAPLFTGRLLKARFVTGSTPQIKVFSSFYKPTSQAKCLFLLFHFRCAMDIFLSDGSIVSKRLETAPLRLLEKLQTLLLLSLNLI